MVATRSALGQRWFKRYRCYLIMGTLIFTLQIYMAVRFFTLNGDDVVQNVWNPHDQQLGAPGGSTGDANNDAMMENNSAKMLAQLDDEELTLQRRKQSTARLQKPQSVDGVVGAGVRLRTEELDFALPCDIDAREAISAIHRAKTQRCKSHIANVSCALKGGSLYERRVPSYCPSRDGVRHGRALGCYKDDKNYRLLSGYYGNNKGHNSPEFCIGQCIQSGFPYAGVQYGTECFCGSTEPPAVAKLPDSSCNMKCPFDEQQICGGYFTMDIYETGINLFAPQIATTSSSKSKPVKIAFLLTLNGRALRQVKRLIKILYNVDHYYYIHVDIRQDYLFRELLPLERQFENVRLTRRRFATIWGGASLLHMLRSTMRELLEQQSHWRWDFVLNLSESDYPVKTLDRLAAFLAANANCNFVKSHGREVQRFIQKQGLDKTFVECDTHMWRVGDRTLPYGIQIDGGSDWVALSRAFVQYVTAPLPDALVAGMLRVFNYTLLPAESFFHTVLRNSRFCATYVDNNLHVTNWKRKLGCKCQYKHVVDWCGCSPNDFTPDDWPRIQNTEQRQLFFARKFEPIVNQAVVFQLEQWLLGDKIRTAQVPALDKYWQSVYHHADVGTTVDDSLLTLAHSAIRHKLKTLPCSDGVATLSTRVLEVTSYHTNDSYRHTLIMFELLPSPSSPVVLGRCELAIAPRSRLVQRQLSPLANRLRSMHVSSDYDQKEQLSRNFLRSLGPYSEPVLVYNFAAANGDSKTSDRGSGGANITFVWIDPAGRLADVDRVLLDNQSSIGYVKPDLKHPLLPGAWKVLLVSSRKVQLLAEMEFLVTPLAFYAGNSVTATQVNFLHAGGPDSLVLRGAAEAVYGQMLPKEFDVERLEHLAHANSKRFGRDLDEWIDTLFGKFYELIEFCVVADMIRTNSELPGVCLTALHGFAETKSSDCASTVWSSFAPDPKSHIGSVNGTTGNFDFW